MMHNLIVFVAAALLMTLATACSSTGTDTGAGASADSVYKRHNEWARFGRPDVGGSRANDR